MKTILKIPGYLIGSVIVFFIFFALPFAFMALGAGHVEIKCSKKAYVECQSTEALAFGIYPKIKKINDVTKAKLKRGEDYYTLYLIGPNNSIKVNSYSNNAEIRNSIKLKKNINRYLKDDTKTNFYQKNTYWTPFFVLGFLGVVFSSWFIVSSILIAIQPNRNQQVQKLISGKLDIKEIQKHLNLFYLPNITLRGIGNYILLITVICSCGLIFDIFYFNNFDGISFFWILFLAPSYWLAFWLRTAGKRISAST